MPRHEVTSDDVTRLHKLTMLTLGRHSVGQLDEFADTHFVLGRHAEEISLTLLHVSTRDIVLFHCAIIN